MSIELTSVESHLTNLGLKYRRAEDRLILGTTTDTYVNELGNKSAVFVIALDEGGEFLSIGAPLLYHFPYDPEHAAIFAYLCHRNNQSKAAKWCYDPRDGEVSLSTEIFIEDGTYTQHQIRRSLSAMLQFIDESSADFLFIGTNRKLPPELDLATRIAERVTKELAALSVDDISKVLEFAKDIQRQVHNTKSELNSGEKLTAQDGELSLPDKTPT